MRKMGDRYMYSATDLVNYVACPYLTHLDRLAFTEDLKRTEIDDQSKMITEKGKEHEARYLKLLQSSGKTVFEIPRIKGASAAEEAERTLEALKQGHDFVYQAPLCDGQLAGYTDFLMRVDTKSDLGDFSYEVIDSKLGNKEKTSHLIQLCFYSELLHKTQGVKPVHAHIYPGTKKLLTFKVAHYFDYYRGRRDAFLKEMQNASTADLYPEPCAHCSTCHWRDLCKKRWNDDDHLSLVANITRPQRKKLVKVGISTVAQLAASTEESIEGMSKDTFTRLRDQAFLQVDSRTHNNEPKIQLLPPRPGVPAFGQLPESQEGDLFYDIEGDPLLKEEFLTATNPKIRDGLEYLHGFTWRSASGELHYRAFWATSKAKEKKCYEKLIMFLTKHADLYPHAKIYHYSAYEKSALKRLSSQYPTHTEKLDRLLRENRFLDLYKVVKESIRVSEPRYSIKNLERFYSEKRELEVENGGASVVWFEQYLETGDRAKLRDIRRYNKKDCDSTYELFVWLHGLKAQSTKKFNVNWNEYAIRVAEDKKAKKNKKEKDADAPSSSEEADQRIRQYAVAFGIDALQEKKPEERTDIERFRELLFYLADFYRREMKPTWWQSYAWKERPTTMIDEPECLGQVSLDTSKPLGSILKSHLIHYVFPPQETKLTEGDKLFDMLSLQSYGTIHQIDPIERTLLIKLGNTKDPLTQLELAPLPNDSMLKLISGLDKFLAAMENTDHNYILDGGRDYPHVALVDILLKKLPSFKDGAVRREIVSVSAGHKEFQKQLLNAALELDNSYLFIQGPPGTGKTYFGARLAKSLMERGKRIGVTSNSHKAIHNFIKEVDKIAAEESFSFQGAKKSDKDDEDKQYNPKNDQHNPNAQIIDFFDNKKVNFDELDLIAGTAWTFILDEQYQKLDYLIIDEASQLSLAHLIAAGVSARNLILIGDPQQLPQPLQGVHPGDLSLSPLEYLLEGEGTVPKNMGIFLDVCRRMHTDICEVLSHHVYDGRLNALEENGVQKIITPSPILATKGTGILFHPCDHDGNTNSSPEEVHRVAMIYRELLGCSFRDKEGVERPLSQDDIMVIAPYNIQVNNLRSALGKGAKVGTIDIFQGGEAPVVIISMTASSAEETPRGIDFLFSQQRINVALSRAKALAIIVGSPRLFGTKCNSTKQMELVNFFCAIAQ